jgi:hypothetical protein
MGLDFHIATGTQYKINGKPATRHEVMSLVEEPEHNIRNDNLTTVTIEIELAHDVPEPKTHNPYGPHWSYGGFSRFRERLWDEIGPMGIPLQQMWGFKPFALDVIAQTEWSKTAVRWEDIEPHPLHELINHSDCDGELTAEQCSRIAPALREVVAQWDEGDYDRTTAEDLAAYMDVCAETGRPLVFC